MHELSVAEAVCRRVAERVGGAAIERLVVEVGALSGVNRDALEFCLGEAARLAGLRLRAFTVRIVPAAARCACGRVYEAKELTEPCPACGGYERSLSGGEDVVVSELLVVEEKDEQETTRAHRNREERAAGAR